MYIVGSSQIVRIFTDAAAAIYELLVANANTRDLKKRSLVSG